MSIPKNINSQNINFQNSGIDILC